MPLSSLRLRDFRCYASLQCPLTSGITIFTGSNAQGKTSLLEAACVLLRLQSPRTSSARELIRFGSPSFGIAGSTTHTELRHEAGPDGKSLLAGGQTVRRSADYLAASELVVWFSNSDRSLVTGTSDLRRRYLDFLGSQLFPDYLPTLRRCDAALRSRNFLLRRDTSPPWPQIDAYSRILATEGARLTELRSSLMNALGPAASAAHTAVSLSSESLSLPWHPGSEPDYLAQLERLRPEELRRPSPPPDPTAMTSPQPSMAAPPTASPAKASNAPSPSPSVSRRPPCSPPSPTATPSSSSMMSSANSTRPAATPCSLPSPPLRRN